MECWRRLPFAYFAYALVLCAQALSYPTQVEPMESFSRYLLVIFPIFMGWGAWLGSRPVARRVVLHGIDRRPGRVERPVGDHGLGGLTRSVALGSSSVG